MGQRLRRSAENERKHARNGCSGEGARACDDESAARPDLRPPNGRTWRICRAKRREFLRETLDIELVDALRPVEILEAVLPKLPQATARGLVVFEDGRRCPRD